MVILEKGRHRGRLPGPPLVDVKGLPDYQLLEQAQSSTDLLDDR
jgi:hypothetical protein